MTEVLLRELSNSDIDWMSETGRQQEIPAETVLIGQGKATDSLYVLLDGTLTVAVPGQDDNSDPLSRAFAALAGPTTTGREVVQIKSGEVVGETAFVNARPSSTTIRTIERSLVLSIPKAELVNKLQHDTSFAAHFYRAIAILLSTRLQKIVNDLGGVKLAQDQALKKVLLVFGELSDSDIDWMISTGQKELVMAGTTLIQEGRPVDALYILLSGMFRVSLSEAEGNPLMRAFATLSSGEMTDREIARISSGEIIGEMPFIDASAPSTTVKALQDSLVLAIPRQELTVKLQQDMGFASRFYRVIASLLSDRMGDIVNRIGYGRRAYSRGQALDEETFEDELDSHILDKMSLAGTRFDWMLRRLRSQ